MNTSSRTRTRLEVAVLLLALSAHHTVAAQSAQSTGAPPTDGSCERWRAQARPYGQSRPGDDPVLPKFEIRRLDTRHVTALRGMLRNGCWADARQLYFGVYQASIPDWIIYIDASGTVVQQFHHAGRSADGSTDPHVHGMEFVYALAFWDYLPNSTKPQEHTDAAKASLTVSTDTSKIDITLPKATVTSSASVAKPKLVFGRRVKVIERDPTLGILIAALGKAAGIAAPASPSVSDTAIAATLAEVEADADSGRVHMYAAATRFEVVENMRMELSVDRDDKQPFAPRRSDNQEPVQRVLINISNAREPHFDVGVLPAMSFGRPIRSFTGTTITSESSGHGGNVYVAVAGNAFWFEQWLATRVLHTRESWRRASIGPIIGTNILRGSLGDELVVGLSLGHVIGDGGIVLGGNYMAEPQLNGTHVANPRKWRFLAGFLLTI